MVNWSSYGDIDTILLTDENVDDAFKVCVIEGFVDAGASFSGGIGTRIGSIFVIGVISTFVTVLPLLTQKFNFSISVWFYLFARYFGAGVIIATAFVHLMDPAYGEIGPDTCVGMWGNWATYSWPPALMLIAIFGIFFIDIASEVYVARKYGKVISNEPNVQDILTKTKAKREEEQQEASKATNECDNICCDDAIYQKESANTFTESLNSQDSVAQFNQQIAAFLILEFGVIFHSVIIGLNLGSTDYDEFKTLYIVLVFHQSFEGLGIGARLSAIPWPSDKPSWQRYMLCIIYGLVTPVSIAIGLGVRTTYVAGGFAASIVSGVLDALSAGILVYTGMIELMARDFVFNDEIKQDMTKLLFSMGCMTVGTGIMALIGKWA